MQKIKKSFNTGNLVTVISAILMLIASFLPFVADRYRSYNYVDINDLIDEELFSIFFYCSLIGAVVIAFFSALRINWACILCSFLLLIPNGITIAICVIAVADVGGSANLGIGFYIFAVATLAMVIFSIVGAVKGKKEMRALPMNGGVPQYQAGPQYQAQP
ncbi:MAG: hypothetical protein Q4D54_06205, partial [Eubacteriales bacterium]|nr:hypothetical protein [Eubacteriales bacterium]